MEEQKRKRAKLFSLKYLFHDFVKITATLPGLLWFRPKYVYKSAAAKKKARGGVMVIANHISKVDPVYVMFGVWYRRHHFVAMKELFNGWFLKLLFKGFLCIPIDRDNFSFSSFKEIVRHLRDGEVVTMFPEGKINEGEDLQAFKSGMVLMALKGGAPVLPVYTKKRKNIFRRLVFAIGEPIDLASYYGPKPDSEQIEKLTGLLFEAERELESLADGYGKRKEVKS